MVGPICGYYGARDYNKNLIYCFVAYYVIDIANAIYLMAIGQLIGILFLMIDAFILRYIFLLITLLNESTQQDIEFLRNPPVDSIVVVNNGRYFYAF